ncbi:MAG: DUF4834 family protein [Prevotella sp.]|nr:DUF4834 family protein [Prevotella sp.]
MTFIAFLLKFAFFIFIIFLALIVWIAYTFYKQLRRTRRHFNPYGQQNQSYSSQEKPQPTGNTITDNRPMEERRKQVIPDSEGEYVDFTEADDTKTETL